MQSPRQRAGYLLCGLSLVLVLGISPAMVPEASGAPVAVTFDARALTAIGMPTFDLVQGSSGTGALVGSGVTATVQELLLEPATYTLRAPAGGGSGAVTLPFTVTAVCTLTVASPLPPGDVTPPAPPTGLRVQ